MPHSFLVQPGSDVTLDPKTFKFPWQPHNHKGSPQTLSPSKPTPSFSLRRFTHRCPSASPSSPALPTKHLLCPLVPICTILPLLWLSLPTCSLSPPHHAFLTLCFTMVPTLASHLNFQSLPCLPFPNLCLEAGSEATCHPGQNQRKSFSPRKGLCGVSTNIIFKNWSC